MKKTILALALAGTTTIATAHDPVKTLDNRDQKVSYGFGLMLGKRMTNDLPDLNVDTFIKGVKDAVEGKAAMMTDEEIGQLLNEYQREQQQKQMEQVQQLSEENKKTGTAFLEENKNKEGVVTLESGLQYKIIKEGKGIQPGPSDTVRVHYTGSLINGTVFDSSVDRGEPVSFPVNGVIQGWTEALQLMPQGSKWQLFIPADLAYGPNGNRSIGPNETLLFDVELLEVIK
ncbi:MAG: peptidylprolyl isomerase [Oleiphilus sp.]|nr:MAG: peptidylprolyl isomerase [Oleiphilus sp.]